MVEEDQSNFPSVVLPNSNFLYQNSVTGQISKVPLSVAQLCRILCCPSQSSPLRHLNSATNVLLLEPDGSYSKAGWRPANQVPVLKEAVALWYYHHQQLAPNRNDSDKGNSTNGATSTEAVSCRELAALYSKMSINSQFQVSGVLTQSEWKPVTEIPNLMMALQMFADETKQAVLSTSQSQSASDGGINNPDDNIQEVQDELEVFLKSTEQHAGTFEQEENDESYESDGGTLYIKDPRTGNWVHRDLLFVPPSLVPSTKKRSATDATAHRNTAVETNTAGNSANRKSKKAKFSSKKARCWIYVSGLPTDCTADEVASVFGKAGLLDLDEETQRPKIKLYRDKATGQPKGDASICYARPESVSLAISLLDDTPFRLDATLAAAAASTSKIKVEAAKFEQHGDKFDDSRRRERTVSAKRKVAKLATQQALDWDDVGLEANGRLTGGRKGLRIIVLKHLFDPNQFQPNEKGGDIDGDDDRFFHELERDLRTKCEQFGVVEKMTVFSHNPEGVVIVKFAEPSAASDAVRQLNGYEWTSGKPAIEAIFWDGVTDYTAKEKEKEAKEEVTRHEEFGKWLENQEDLPEEFQLKSE